MLPLTETLELEIRGQKSEVRDRGLGAKMGIPSRFDHFGDKYVMELVAAYVCYCRHNGLEFLAIVDGERLIGMCSRHAIDSLLGGRYGFSLWARKPIAEHVAANETRIVVTSAITDVLREVFARDPENFYDDVLLVDE